MCDRCGGRMSASEDDLEDSSGDEGARAPNYHPGNPEDPLDAARRGAADGDAHGADVLLEFCHATDLLDDDVPVSEFNGLLASGAPAGDSDSDSDSP